MKKERNAVRQLNDLYLYMDYACSYCHDEEFTQKQLERLAEIKPKYDKIYKNRSFSPYEWHEYYGLFHLDNNKIGIDPKRMKKILSNCVTEECYKIMGKRNTTYFHPKKEKYFDYSVNLLVDTMNRIKNNFLNNQEPLIEKELNNLNEEAKKQYVPGDCAQFQMGIYDYEEATMWTMKNNMIKQRQIEMEIFETRTSLYSQFIQEIASQIEAVSVQMYSRINHTTDYWKRNFLYNNINSKRISSKTLPSFKYHDELYLIWNFLKHNNVDAYEKLKKYYPEVLLDCEYNSGEAAKYFLKLSKKLVIELIDGVKSFFIEWCELNLDESYIEAQWNYEEYFINIVNDQIESFTNPLGLEF